MATALQPIESIAPSVGRLRRTLELTTGARLSVQELPAAECLPSGIAAVDAIVGGWPRGGLSEVCGPVSSGRTTLLHASLAAAGARGEYCALVDANDAFDPVGAQAAGVQLSGLLWVRCGGNAEHALKAADLLVQNGGFGLVAFDLADTPPLTARRISLASWYRLRRGVEHTPTVLLALLRESNARSCASLSLDLRGQGARWSGYPGCSRLLRGVEAAVSPRKPARPATSFEAHVSCTPLSTPASPTRRPSA